MKKKPLVSVVIPSYNRSHFLLTRSIPSVLKQTLDNWELIVVGDGPPDKQLRNVVTSFNDPRIKYLEIERTNYENLSNESFWNCAGAAARNYGLQMVRGEYIAPLDDDDEFTENHLKDSIQYLEQHNLDFVYGGTIIRDFELGNEYIDFIPWERSITENLFPHRNIMYHSNVVYHSKFKHLHYPITGEFPADWGLWQKLYAEGAKFGDIPTPQSIYYKPIGQIKVRINIPFVPAVQEFSTLLEEICDSKILSNYGPFVLKFESLVSEYLGGVGVSSTSSGDTGLIVALQAIKNLISPEQNEVILPSYTFASTANAVIWNGFKPVFADIMHQHLGLSTETIEPHISKRTACILPVNSHGNPVDIDGISQLAHIHKIQVIWDSASAFGSKYKGRPVGSSGGLNVFSFSGTKTVSTGEGGVITYNDASFKDVINKGRNYGFWKDYQCQIPGINAKMSEFHALMGTLTIPKTEYLISLRQKIAQRYQNNLADITKVKMQGQVHPSVIPNYKDMVLIFDSELVRRKVQKSLEAHGIQTKLYYRPLHLMPSFHRFSHKELSVTENIGERVMCVPIFHSMRFELVDDICQIIRDQVIGKWD